MSSRKRAADEAPTSSIPISLFYNKHACHERQDKDILSDNLKSLGLQVKSDVPGDGSCFFHAVLDQCNRLKTSTGLPQLTNDTANPQAMGKTRAMQLRTAVINYFEDLDPTDPLVMSMDIPGVVPSGEVDRMKKYGTFVEEWIIRATAQMLGRDIHIVNSVKPCMPTGRKTKICCLTPGEEEPLLVGHLVNGCHYLSLEPASDQSTKSSMSNADLLPPAARRPVTSAGAVSVSSIHSRPNVGSTSFQENQSPLQKSSTPPQKSSTPPQKSPFLPQKYPVPLQTSSTPLQKSSTLHQKSPTPQQKSLTPQQKFPPPPQQRSPAPPSVGHSPIPAVAENTTTSSEKSQSRPSTTLKKREKGQSCLLSFFMKSSSTLLEKESDEPVILPPANSHVAIITEDAEANATPLATSNVSDDDAAATPLATSNVSDDDAAATPLATSNVSDDDAAATPLATSNVSDDDAAATPLATSNVSDDDAAAKALADMYSDIPDEPNQPRDIVLKGLPIISAGQKKSLNIARKASNSPASQMQTITNEPGPRMDSDMAIVTIKDFLEVTNALGPDELQHLFHYLDLEERDIETAAKGADTTDPRLQAIAVLSMWRKKVGRIATRGALFAAKKKAVMEKRNQNDSKEKKTHEKWRAILQKSYKKRRGEIKFGSNFKSIADMDDIFVDLELIQIGDKINEKKKQLDSYKDLFQIQDNKPRDKTEQDKDPRDKDGQDKKPKDKYDKDPRDKDDQDKYPRDKDDQDKDPRDKDDQDKYPRDKDDQDKDPRDKDDQDKYPRDKDDQDKYPRDKDDQDKYPRDKDDQDKDPRDKDDQLCTYILLRGNAGSGKTTLVSRISYKWATLGTDDDYKYLQMFDLVITLDVRKFIVGQNLEQAIKRQLLPSVSEETIAEVLSTIGPKCLFLVDGYDEMSEQSWLDENQVLDSPLLDDSFVILTSRPHVVDKFCQKYQQNCAHVQLSGFSEAQVHEYVKRFFKMQKKPYLAESFSHRIKATPHLKSMSTTPILLLMLCHLWLVHKTNLPESYTQLYVEAVKYLNKHWQESYKGEKDVVLKELGEVALDNLLEGKLTFDTRGLSDECIINACKIGLVYSEEMDGDRTCVTFIHATFHEYCAAVFLVSLLETDTTRDTSRFNAYLQKINLHRLILPFCCGLNTNAACSILAFVVRGFHHGDDRNKPCHLLIRPFNEALGSNVNHKDDELIIAELNKSLSETCQSVIELSLGTTALLESIQMFTFLAFLSSLPLTLKSFNLTSSNIVDPLDTSMQVQPTLKPSIKMFKMCHCNVCGNTLKRWLACIPNVDECSLKDIDLTDKDNSVQFVKTSKQSNTRNRYVNNENHLLLTNVLKCMPNLKALSLKRVNAQELESQSFISTDKHRAFTEFSLTAGKISESSLFQLLCSMPSSLKDLVLNVTLEEGYISLPLQLKMIGTQLRITKSTLGVGKRPTSFISLIPLMKLLCSFPALDEVYLESIKIERNKDDNISAVRRNLRSFSVTYENVQTSLQSLKQLNMSWCNTDPNTLLHILSMMPALKGISLHMVDVLRQGEQSTCAIVQPASLNDFLNPHDDSNLFEQHESFAELGTVWGHVSQTTLREICKCRPLLKTITLKDMHVIETSGIFDPVAVGCVSECEMIHVRVSRKTLKSIINSLPCLKGLTLDKSCILCEEPHLEVIVECTVGSNAKLEASQLNQFKNCETFLEQLSMIPSIDHLVVAPLLRETDGTRLVPFKNIDSGIFAFANQVLLQLDDRLLNKSFMFSLFCLREQLDTSQLSEYHRDFVLSTCHLHEKTLLEIIKCIPSLSKVDMRECCIQFACSADNLKRCQTLHPSLQMPMWSSDWYKPHELKLSELEEVHVEVMDMERKLIDRTVIGSSQQTIYHHIIPWKFTVRIEAMPVDKYHHVRTDITLKSCRLTVSREKLVQILADFKPEEPVILRRIDLQDSSIIFQ